LLFASNYVYAISFISFFGLGSTLLKSFCLQLSYSKCSTLTLLFAQDMFMVFPSSALNRHCCSRFCHQLSYHLLFASSFVYYISFFDLELAQGTQPTLPFGVQMRKGLNQPGPPLGCNDLNQPNPSRYKWRKGLNQPGSTGYKCRPSRQRFQPSHWQLRHPQQRLWPCISGSGIHFRCSSFRISGFSFRISGPTSSTSSTNTSDVS